MRKLFTVSSLKFCNDSAITSLEANQNRQKIKNYANKQIKCTLKLKTIILICGHTKISKLDKPSVGRDLKIFALVRNTEFLKKHLQR